MLKSPKIIGVNLDDERACLFNSKGEFLWQSRGWFEDRIIPECALRIMGSYWHELVHPDDLPGLLAWFADGREGPHTFRCMIASDGSMGLFTQYKLPYGKLWLTFGEYSPIPMMPPRAALPILES